MTRKTVFAVTAFVFLAPARATAGGGPANVMVLYNGDDADAATTAQYYRDARSIPDGQLCGLSAIDPTQRTIDFADYEPLIHQPFILCLNGLPQPDEIDYLVLVRGLPYRVNLPSNGFYTSLSAMLQIHNTERTSDGELLAGQPQAYGTVFQASIRNPFYISGFPQAGDYTVTNPYSSWYTSSPGIVRQAQQPSAYQRFQAGEAFGWDFTGNLFVVTRLDGFDHQDARDLVDRAVAGDETFPAEEILCMEGSDEPRAARDPECEFVTRYLSGAGFTATYLTPFDGNLTGRTVSAYFTGTANLRNAIAGNTYVPGAITCNLTSTGAAPANFFCDAGGTVCPENESQTSIARFVRAGATGAHGTVAEPLNNTFPNAGTLLLYTFGYNLAESYFFNQRFLYWQNLYLGDPLATPYAERPVVTLSHTADLPQNVPLTATATHPDSIAEVRVYLDGAFDASDATDHLEIDLSSLSVGTQVHVLAVAIARNAVVTRTGWPEETQEPRPDVQGWTTATVTIADPVVVQPDAGMAEDSGTLSDASTGTDGEVDGGGGQGKSGGCGCNASRPISSFVWIFLVLAVLLRIRPRAKARRPAGR